MAVAVRVRCLAAFLGLAACAVAAPGMAEVDDGWTAYNVRDYSGAVRAWLPAAQAGDVDAQFGLGIAYDLGQGVAADPRTACSWYSRAGARGHSSAAFNTAVLYDSGRCGPRRTDLAATWYARAAAAGHGRAQFNLAQLYATGDGVPLNPDLAATWFRAASSNGVTAAAARVPPPPRSNAARPLLPARPVGSDDAQPAVGGSTVLVWTGPEQPGHVRFFVEMAALQPDGAREILARYVDESALMVPLPASGRSYAWRVLTVGIDPERYVATPWQRLEAGP